MSEKPPITTVAGQVLSDDDQTPEARRLAGAVLNQAREDQADDAESEPSAPTEGPTEASEQAMDDQGPIDGGGSTRDEQASELPEQGDLPASERRAELETERADLQRIHSKSLNEPGFARRVMAIQARLAEIDAELGE